MYNFKMTGRETSSSNRGEVEFLLSDLTDDTPPSSCDGSVGDDGNEMIQKNCEDQPNENTERSTNGQDEGMCKFEKEAINKILAIKSEVEKIKEVISSTEKEELDKNFKMYEEVLISKTISLDGIQTKGIEKIKEIRKETILFVQDTLNLLDLKRK